MMPTLGVCDDAHTRSLKQQIREFEVNLRLQKKSEISSSKNFPELQKVVARKKLLKPRRMPTANTQTAKPNHQFAWATCLRLALLTHQPELCKHRRAHSTWLSLLLVPISPLPALSSHLTVSSALSSSSLLLVP